MKLSNISTGKLMMHDYKESLSVIQGPISKRRFFEIKISSISYKLYGMKSKCVTTDLLDDYWNDDIIVAPISYDYFWERKDH